MYNKHQNRKIADKKVLHKIGKQWKTISVALLMAIGGTAFATQVSHANANVSNNQNNSVVTNHSNNQRTALLVNAHKINANNNAQQRQSGDADPQAINHQANNLHKSILINNIGSQNSSVSSKSSVSTSVNNNSSANFSVATVAPKVDNANNDQQNYGTYDGLNPSYGAYSVNDQYADDTISYHDIYSHVDGMRAPTSKTVSGQVGLPHYYSLSDIPKGYAMVNSDGQIINLKEYPSEYGFNFDNNKGQTNHIINIAPVYAGMTYKYNKQSNSVRFVNGSLKDGTKFSLSPFKNVQLMSFGRDLSYDPISVNTLNVTNASDMFSNMPNLKILNLGLNSGFINIQNDNHMIAHDPDLSILVLPKGFDLFNEGELQTNYHNDNMFTGDKSLYRETNFNGNFNYHYLTSDVPLNEFKNGRSSIEYYGVYTSYKNTPGVVEQVEFYDSENRRIVGAVNSDGGEICGKEGTPEDITKLPDNIAKNYHLANDGTQRFNLRGSLNVQNSCGHFVDVIPNESIYDFIYNDSYIANQDSKEATNNVSNVTEYADPNALNIINNDAGKIQSDQMNIENDLSADNDSALSDANGRASLANDTLNNIKSLYNSAESVASTKYNNIYSKSYDAYYDASKVSNDANAQAVKNDSSNSKRINNDGLIISSARSAINTDYATYNVSSASTEDNIAKNALRDANSLYNSVSNSGASNYNNIYNDYYNAAYASNAINSLINSYSVSVTGDEIVASSAAFDIKRDLSINTSSALRDANNKAQVAHNAWSKANNIIYNAIHDPVYNVNYVCDGMIIRQGFVHSVAEAKQFIPYGYLFKNISDPVSYGDGEGAFTVDLIFNFHSSTYPSDNSGNNSNWYNKYFHGNYNNHDLGE